MYRSYGPPPCVVAPTWPHSTKRGTGCLVLSVSRQVLRSLFRVHCDVHNRQEALCALENYQSLCAAIKMFAENPQDVQVWKVIILLGGKKNSSDHC